MKKLLVSSKPNIVKEAAWTISNISAGTVEQIQMVIEADLVPLLINVLKHVSKNRFSIHYTQYVY